MTRREDSLIWASCWVEIIGCRTSYCLDRDIGVIPKSGHLWSSLAVILTVNLTISENLYGALRCKISYSYIRRPIRAKAKLKKGKPPPTLFALDRGKAQYPKVGPAPISE